MTLVEKSVELGGETITFQTGRVAKQASGSVWVRAGGTVVLVTAQGSKEPREGVDFLPLTVDYQEKMSAAGKIPGASSEAASGSRAFIARSVSEVTVASMWMRLW